MSTQDSWNWKVPTIKGTKWDTPVQLMENGKHIEQNPDEAFINVYCEGRTSGDPHELYLIGSVWIDKDVVNGADWRERLGQSSEGWNLGNDYYAGDGLMILLDHRRDLQMMDNAGDPASKCFVGDKEIAHERDWITAYQVTPNLTRRVHDFHCKKCGQRASASSANRSRLDNFASLTWRNGIREVPLKSFIKYVIE